jgi:hypothetical protein
VDRHTAVSPQTEPALLGGDPPAAACAGRPQFCGFVDPSATAIAIDTGCRQIAEPGKLRHCRDVVGMAGEHRVAQGIGRHRNQGMGRTVQGLNFDGPITSKENCG